MARYKRRRRVVPLKDTVAGAGGAAGASPRPWLVVILTDAWRTRLYTTMTQDAAFLVHRASSALAGGYAYEHGLTRLVLRETYACRHTARARVGRIRGWPVAERRRLIERSNPDWADLSREEGREDERPTDPEVASAA